MPFQIARLRKNGLRVLCVLCGAESRHYFDRRLRERYSGCCGARLVPRWHLQKRTKEEARADPKPGLENVYKHPEHARRAWTLREAEKSRLSAI